MKRRMRFGVAMVLILSFLLAGCVGNNGFEGTVEFCDPLVERCVREALGKKAGEAVDAKECSELKTLVIDTKFDTAFSVNFATAVSDSICHNYVDLSDLKYFTGLKELYIDNYVASDIIVNLDAISNCNKL